MAGRTARGWRVILVVSAVLGTAAAAAAQSGPPNLPPLPKLPPVPTVDDAAVVPRPPVIAEPPPALPPERTRTSLQPPGLFDDPSPFGGDRDPLRKPGPVGDLQPEVLLPDGSTVTLPETVKQLIRFGPRYGVLNDAISTTVGKDLQRITYTGGLIVNVVYLADRPGQPPQEVEFAADNVVLWVKGLKLGEDMSRGLRTERPKAGEEAKAERTTVEMYLSGNVVLRTLTANTFQGQPSEQTLRAEEVYYDLDLNRAIALDADLETKFRIPLAAGQKLDPIHLRGKEIWRLGDHEWRSLDTTVFSSKRPADPTLTFTATEATLTDQVTQRKNIFGVPYRNARTGEPDVSEERLLTAYRTRIKVLGVPVFAYPKVVTELDDPLGPLLGFGVRNDRIFGFQTYTSWDLYKLLGLRGAAGNKWVLHADYLSNRGLGIGTDFTYRNLLGSEYPNSGAISLYFLNDRGLDTLGGFRGIEPLNPDVRGRAYWSHNQELYENGTTFGRFLGQMVYLSDKNYFEQYAKPRFDIDPNQETFAHFYGAQGNASWSALVQQNWNRPWVTETSWLPKLDGGLTGQSFLDDRLLYSTRGTLGYGRFRPATQGSISNLPSEDAATDTLRAGWNQRLAAPIDLGPVRLEPYGVLDLSYYSQDLNGDSVGRLYGGGGASVSMPLSKIYRDVESELWNVRGLNHKVELRANYFAADSNVRAQDLPLMDRLTGDADDFSYRSWRQFAPLYLNTPNGFALADSALFDPTLYANRRLLDGRPETLDRMQVIQAEVRQRWQTKRGLPGNEHTVDWMSLDLSASFYPDRVRDNFGSSFGFFEYNYLWNVGDRFAISSQGWLDPHETGARYFNIGGFFNRPDGSNLYIGYRHTDPVGSRALIAVFGYQMSQKYSMSVASVFDFGTNQAQTTTVAFNRTGTDMTMSLGFSYNAFVNNFGLQFLIVPNGGLAGRNGGIRSIFQ